MSANTNLRMLASFIEYRKITTYRKFMAYLHDNPNRTTDEHIEWCRKRIEHIKSDLVKNPLSLTEEDDQ